MDGDWSCSYFKNGVKKPTLLVAAPTPPPWAGPEAATQTLLSSPILSQHFTLQLLRTNLNTTNRDKGRIRAETFLQLFRLWGALFWRLARAKPDRLYLHLSQNWQGFLRDASFILWGNLFSIRIAAHFHGGDFAAFYRRQSSTGQSFIRMILRKVDRVLVLSERLRSQFDGLVDPQCMAVVANAVLETPSLPIAKNSSQITILSLGSIASSKGSGLLLEAGERLCQMYPTVHLELVGEVIQVDRNITRDAEGNKLPSTDFLRKPASERIQLYPPEYGDTKIRRYQKADVFVLASYSEGWPMAVLEAMSFGLPLVLTSVGGLPDTLKEREHALFIPPGDAQALEKALAKLIQDPALRRLMGENNRVLARTVFHPDVVARQLIKALES